MIFSILSQTLLFLLPASIILALEKVTIFGLPVYFLEALFLIFFVTSFWQVTRESLETHWKSFDRWVALGASLFIVGAVMSTLHQSPVTLTSLGQLKSWFGFPLVFVVVLYSLKDGKEKEREFFYTSWLIGVASIAVTALYGYSMSLLTYDGRLAFPYSSANFLALLSAPSVLLATFFLWRANTWPKKGFLLVLMSIFLAVIYLTHSYNTWLALTLGLLAALLVVVRSMPRMARENHRTVIILALGLALFLSTFFFLEQGSNKWQNLFLENGRSSFDSRLMIWQSAGTILQDRWFLGIGVGNFQREYLAYQPHFTPYLEWAVPQPHNLWLAVWLQTGLVGLLGLILMLGRLITLLLIKLYRSIQKKDQDEGALLLGLWILFLAYGLFDTPYFRNDLAFLFWLQVLLTYWYVEEED